MHGLIFSSFRQFTWTRLPDHAEAIWAELPAYEPTQTYDDAEFQALLDHAVSVTGTDRRGLLHEFGRFTGFWSFRVMRRDYYDASGGTRRFLLDVESRIHDAVRTTTPGAAPPQLQVSPLGAAGVSIAYTSERRLCELLEGLVAGIAEYYGERFDVEQPMCMHRGDAACSFLVVPA